MGYCVNCLFQGDNSQDANGNGTVFCMVRRRWMLETDTCKHFTDYADLSKEVRSKYAFEIRDEESKTNKISEILKLNWWIVLATLVTAFIMFILTVKFFDKYIF
jgi:hypothetical protein